MSDDPRRRSRQPDDGDFTDALDDLFGSEQTPANTNPAPPRQERQAPYSPPVSQPNPSPGKRPVSEHNANPAPSYPARPANTANDPAPGRSVARILGFGCLAIVVVTGICMAVLLVIGMAAGGSSASPAEGVVSTEEVVLASSSGPQLNNELVPMASFAPVNRRWRVAVIDAIPDATQDVLDRNQFNDPPADDHQYFIATVSVRNTGSTADVFPATLLFRAIASSGHEYTTFDDFCGVVPDAFFVEEIAPGQTHTGNVCWMVASADADSLVMLSTDFSGEYEARYFSLYR
jgi:hypothetical protein